MLQFDEFQRNIEKIPIKKVPRKNEALKRIILSNHTILKKEVKTNSKNHLTKVIIPLQYIFKHHFQKKLLTRNHFYTNFIGNHGDEL